MRKLLDLDEDVDFLGRLKSLMPFVWLLLTYTLKSLKLNLL